MFPTHIDFHEDIPPNFLEEDKRKELEDLLREDIEYLYSNKPFTNENIDRIMEAGDIAAKYGLFQNESIGTLPRAPTETEMLEEEGKIDFVRDPTLTELHCGAGSFDKIFEEVQLDLGRDDRQFMFSDSEKAEPQGAEPVEMEDTRYMFSEELRSRNIFPDPELDFGFFGGPLERSLSPDLVGAENVAPRDSEIQRHRQISEATNFDFSFGHQNSIKAERMSPDFDFSYGDQNENIGPIESKPRSIVRHRLNRPSHKKSRVLTTPTTNHEFIDTAQLCKDIYATLKNEGIPQTLFAKNVLGRTQGTLSDTLKKPKPWDEMMAAGQKIYIQMFEWLGLPQNERMEKLRAAPSPVMTPKMEVKSEPSTSAEAVSVSTDTPKPIKKRFKFTDVQSLTLKTLFKEQRNPSSETKEAIAKELNLEIHQVDTFFMNARRRNRLSMGNDVKEESME